LPIVRIVKIIKVIHTMSKIHSEGTERLDFLLVIEAILQHKTITRASQALDVSQSALSHTVTRLRERMGDPLFVRVGGEMQPTPLVVRLAEPIARSLRIIREEILSTPEFVPATTTRVFKLCVGEVGAFVMIPRIVRKLREHAPHAFLSTHDTPRANIAAALEDGSIDVAIGYYPELKASIYQQRLFSRTYVGIVREGHPRVGARLTSKQLKIIPLVRTPSTVAINRWIDTHLDGASSMEIAMETPYIMALAPIIAESDWIALIPDELVSAFRKLAPIRAVALPLDLPQISVRQHWHRRFKEDSANRFIRQLIHDALHEP
jgi:DNA-binding transcriptional LysR family regulator